MHSPNDSMEYRYFRLDRCDPDIAGLATKYRALRLEALKQSPESFSSTFEIESKFSDEFWQSRIVQPGKETFVCAAVTDTDVAWVAQVTIRGPFSARDFDLPPESLQPATKPDEDESKWQMLSLFTLPSHRSKGLGKRLCQEAFHYLRSLSDTRNIPKEILIRIMVKAGNTGTIKMYENLGFVRTGICTLEEALIANGDAELLPKGDLPVPYRTRGGIIMAVNL